MRKGSITVYLSLILLVILSLLMVLIEGTRLNTIKARVELVTNLGLDSCFAEYNQQLLEKYELFLIDTSYGKSEPSISQIESHLFHYIKTNFTPFSPITKDLLKLSINSCDITNYSRSTDMDGINIYSQIIDYMESKVFLEEFNKLQINHVEANQQELSTFDLEKERKETDQRIIAIDLPKEEIAPDQWEQIEIHNPADVILEKRSIGVFSILIKDQSTISNKGISLQQQPSQRKLNKGNWNQVNKNNISSNFNKFLLLKYLEEKCGNYVLPNKEGPLSYPMEYILAKQDNDFDNLKLVCDKLIRVREASNFFYLLSDQKKLMEVETLAASLSAVILVPELQPLIKYSIILAWAFAESVNDVKILLNNGKIPIIKSDKEWKLSLEAMLNFEGNLTSEPANTSGLEYQDYLKLLLYIQEEKDILLYFMDIVETDLRKENQYFYIDGCINAVDVNFCITSSYGYQFNFSRNYSY